MISCPIQEITIQPYTKQQNCTWYPIQLKLTNNQMLEIKHQYADFVQFSRQIHQQFNLTRADLPKIKKQHYFLKKGTQKYQERQCELQDFCQQLLLMPAVVTCSSLFLSFFATTPAITKVSNSIKRAFSLKSNRKQQQQQQYQDLNEISKHLSQQQYEQQPCTSRPNIQNINRSNRCSTTSTTSTTSSSILFSSSLSSTDDDTIKLKIIYDIQNIIIIRVSRTVSLDQLRSQVIQKFALINILLPDQLVLRTVDCARYSFGSGSSIICSVPADSDLDSDTLISTEQDLSKAMLLKWNALQKVTLRCMV